MADAARALDVRRLSGSLGAEVRGLSLAKAGPADADRLKALLLEHLVLFFPDQHLSPDEHVAFGRLFGPLESHPNLAIDAERPEFFELRATDGSGGIADEWHSDLTCEPSPSQFAILQMKKCPAFGGDTMWASMYKAFEALSPPLQAFCEGLSALHDASAHGHPERKAIHPVVRVHPDTGRKSLFVNHHFTRRIVELSQDESDMLLGHLRHWVASPRFTVRYHWSEGTLAMWDNRCTQHHVLDDFAGERVIQRVTVMGDRPKAAVAARWSPFQDAFSAGSWRDLALWKFLKDGGREA